MKVKGFIAVFMVIAVMFVVPSMGFAHGHWYHRHCCYSSHWWVPGAVIASGLLLSVAIIRPWYTPPKTIYVYPSSTIVRTQDNSTGVVSKRAYATPDPQFISKYGHAGANEVRTGEWVTVPGQQVDGKWIPPHKVWLPSSPVKE